MSDKESGETVQSEGGTDRVYRVFCAYPQTCGAETWTDTEVDANRKVANHHHREPNHLAEYEEWDAEKADQWRDDDTDTELGGSDE